MYSIINSIKLIVTLTYMAIESYENNNNNCWPDFRSGLKFFN